MARFDCSWCPYVFKGADDTNYRQPFPELPNVVLCLCNRCAKDFDACMKELE